MTTSPSQTDRAYRMTVRGQLFKHLGLQMYSGAVPAITELISNAYDAMAQNVWVTLPLGRPITSRDRIIVRDDGHGMSFSECNRLYLAIGRDRRGGRAGLTKGYNGVKPRRVQGRKGIGKLAGFGIANRITIRTAKDKELSHFTMDFKQLTDSDDFVNRDGYSPDNEADDGKQTDEANNAIVTMTQLKIRRAINEHAFRRSIARRLLILGSDFVVHINGKAITRDEIDFQFRFPETEHSWEKATLTNGKTIQWWAGFCKDTIPEEEQRGFVVYVRGKLAQTPWIFDLSGGAWGQHGLQYLTGEVQADFLDEKSDLIATDRGSVRWEDPMAAPLKEWGQATIRHLLNQWVEKRRDDKRRSPTIIYYLEQASRLPHRERQVFETVVNRICAIPQLDKDEEGKEIADQLVEFAYNALTNRGFIEIIKSLNAASETDIDRFVDILSEWSIIEAVSMAHIIRGHLEIIRKFGQMIREKVPEKPDMQDYIKANPWLVDPKWTLLMHERALDTLIAEEFGLARSKESEGQTRFDFFCLGEMQNTVYVVEAKRPGDLVGRKEFDQLRDYVLFLKRRLDSRPIIEGLLIADRIRPEDREHADMVQQSGVFRIRSWNNLFDSAHLLHVGFLDAVKQRVPSDDPRVQSLEMAVNDE